MYCCIVRNNFYLCASLDVHVQSISIANLLHPCSMLHWLLAVKKISKHWLHSRFLEAKFLRILASLGQAISHCLHRRGTMIRHQWWFFFLSLDHNFAHEEDHDKQPHTLSFILLSVIAEHNLIFSKSSTIIVWTVSLSQAG